MMRVKRYITNFGLSNKDYSIREGHDMSLGFKYFYPDYVIEGDMNLIEIQN